MTALFKIEDTLGGTLAVLDGDRLGGPFKVRGPHAFTVFFEFDRAGASPYNMALSRRRADAVTQGLVARGLCSGLVAFNAFGETRPRVLTSDGLLEPRNRRVEVVIGSGQDL